MPPEEKDRVNRENDAQEKLELPNAEEPFTIESENKLKQLNFKKKCGPYNPF